MKKSLFFFILFFCCTHTNILFCMDKYIKDKKSRTPQEYSLWRSFTTVLGFVADAILTPSNIPNSDDDMLDLDNAIFTPKKNTKLIIHTSGRVKIKHDKRRLIINKMHYDPNITGEYFLDALGVLEEKSTGEEIFPL